MTPVWAVAPHPDATAEEAPGSFRRHDIRAFAGGMTPPTWPRVTPTSVRMPGSDPSSSRTTAGRDLDRAGAPLDDDLLWHGELCRRVAAELCQGPPTGTAVRRRDGPAYPPRHLGRDVDGSHGA